ncbi:hypothetical protein D3C79_1111150 [compost metagenome]
MTPTFLAAVAPVNMLSIIPSPDALTLPIGLNQYIKLPPCDPVGQSTFIVMFF